MERYYAFTFWMNVTLILFQVAESVTNASTQNTTQCGNITCLHNGRCRTDSSGQSNCQCLAGYDGTTCNDDTDECNFGNPCMHRGICHNSIGSYRCECLEGWSGDIHCDIKENSTTDRKCMPGWIGEWCQDQCLNDSMCGPLEVCTKRGRGLRCICVPGWHGVNCTIDTDECMRHRCPSNAICLNTLGSFECPCMSGWKGDNCDDDIDECLMNPCQHSATCINHQGYYNCTCAIGWKGHTCIEDIDECRTSTNRCPVTSSCVNNPGSYECKCAQGWEGDNCTTDVNECTLSPCLNFGTCKNTHGSYTCTCVTGWKGFNCEYDIDECASKPCNATSKCENSPGSFRCSSIQVYSKGMSDNRKTKIILFAVLGSVLMICSIVTCLGIIKYMWSVNKEVSVLPKKRRVEQKNCRFQHKHQENLQSQQQDVILSDI